MILLCFFQPQLLLGNSNNQQPSVVLLKPTSGSTSGECQPFVNTLQQFSSGEPVSDMGAPSTITNTSHPAPFTVQDGIPLGSSIPLRIKN